jgi:Tol biopolymer transport system component
MDTAGNNLQRLTVRAGGDTTPVWSPDSTKIVFTSSDATQHSQIFLMDANGANSRT